VSDPQSQWALFLLESLVEAGVRDVVVSPGSRSTPLVWAATQTRELRISALIDERSAAFYALGQARVSGRPSLLICTSGTAASNYFPAVIEARESGVPLIVLSADRPFELMHCGAHQTIDQTRLFGAYAPYHELGSALPDREALLGLRRSAWQAVMASMEAPRGAVHLNFRARKPLEPRLDVPSVELPVLGPRPALQRDPPGSAAAERVLGRDVETLLSALASSKSPLLICGAESTHDSASPELVERFAELTGSIVCPESVSQLRFRLSNVGGLLCDTYDWLLGSATLAPMLGPDFALQLGGTPVSAALERLIQQPERGLSYAIAAESGWPDPLHKSASMLRARSGDLLRAAVDVLERRGAAPPRPRLELWRSAQAAARAAIDRHLLAGFGEAVAVAMVVDSLPKSSWLALGNSLPPRLLDRYAAAGARGISLVSQRGASGIEGAIAGAFGAASQADAPLTLLLGDISFLHDIGSLWAAEPARVQRPARSRPVVLVTINNDGGRIFEQLPIAGHPGVPLELWTTPHRMRLCAAAELYGIGYAEAADRSGLRRALESAYAGTGVTLVEVVVDADSALRSQRAVSAELEESFAPLVARVRA
jgi:2-succinyl-5-enolpyruvyl-6-hydroxy-3-cyclohexene-1-carboxylate synthase